MSGLSELVAAGRVKAEALVYVNEGNGNGLHKFEQDMAARGAAPIEGEHYRLNPTEQTEFLRAYTGRVSFMGGLPPHVASEISGMLAERGSIPEGDASGNVHVYNNPLFRAVVSLGAWGTVSSSLVALANAETAARTLEAIKDRKAGLLARLEKEDSCAKALRKCGCRASASERAAKASVLRRKIRNLEALEAALTIAVA